MEAKVVYDLKVVLSQKFKNIIDWYSSEYNHEIAGFIIGEIKDKTFYCEDLIFPKQEVGSGDVDLNSEKGSIGLLRAEVGEEIWSKVIGEWHSHVKMGCFWSSTDENELISHFMSDWETGIFIVSSNKEHLVRVDLSKPFYLSLDELEYEVEEEEDEELTELKEKVKEYYTKKEKEITDFCEEVIENKVTERTYKSKYVKQDYPLGFSKAELNGEVTTDELEDFLAQYEIEQDRYFRKKEDKRNIDREINGMMDFNKSHNFISVSNLKPMWADEIYAHFPKGVLSQETAGNNFTFCFAADSREEYKETKKELRGLVKLLLEKEEDEENEY